MADREKLIELFYDNNVRCDQKIEGLADDVMDIIANGVTILTEPKCNKINVKLPKEIVVQSYGDKWIPVTERLPEIVTTHNTRWDKSTDSIRVLCACVQADGKKMVKEGYCKVYSDGFVHWKIPGTIHSVTHWMPLPQPPTTCHMTSEQQTRGE